MSNKLNITITAADRATKIIRNVNRNMNNMLRPAMQLRRSMKSLTSEVWANPMSRGMYKVGRGAMFAGRQVASFSRPFTAIAGVASVAGIAAMVAEMAKAGRQTVYTSQRIGQSTSMLQRYRGAAIAAGLSTGDMDNSLINLGDTLQGAQFGRNPEALAMMQRLGIGIHRNKDGIVDTARAMNDIADAIARTNNPQTQALIANAFGVESMLPMLRQGSAGLARYLALAERLGAVSDDATAANLRLGQSYSMLKLALEGFENKAAKSPIGGVSDVAITALADLISGGELNKELEVKIANLLLKLKPGGGFAPILNRFNEPKEPPGKIKSFSPQLSIGKIRRPGIPPMPLGMRLNNPGNLRYAGQAGARLGDNGFASFATPQDGLTAMAKQLRLYGRFGNNTLRGIVSTYAPKNENDTAAYISDVSRRTGFDPDRPLNLQDSGTLAPVLSAMVRHEQGSQPFNAAEIVEAINRVEAGLVKMQQTVQVKVEAPAGSRVTQHSRSSSSMAIGHSMPEAA